MILWSEPQLFWDISTSAPLRLWALVVHLYSKFRVQKTKAVLFPDFFRGLYRLVCCTETTIVKSKEGHIMPNSVLVKRIKLLVKERGIPIKSP